MNKKVLHSVIDHIAEQRADAIAIMERSRNLNYSGLRSFSNRIGNNLVNLGAKKGDIVGVYLESGINYVSSILGVNKAGGLFMPMELLYPVKRMEYLLEKMRPSIVITQQVYVADLLKIYRDAPNGIVLKNILLLPVDSERIEVLEIEDNEIKNTSIGVQDDSALAVEVDGDDSNYILYTSGSTGQPKAIEGCHKSLSHFIHWEKGELNLDETVRVSQLAPISFDVSLRDIFVPLICGGTLCVPERNIKREPMQLLNWIGETSVTLIHTVPSIFRLMTSSLKEHTVLQNSIEQISYILLAGEALYGRDVVEWRAIAGNKATLINLYGPTETTLAKLYNRIDDVIADPAAIIPLGKPISNTAVIIISDNEFCNTGIIGEIHIKTPFRSKGYYKDEEQTKSRFIQNPLHKDYEDIVYKTGDLGRYLENGNVEFIGREDGQIKIRGNRVELSEVEKVLMGYEGMKQVVVMPIKRLEADDVLSCYYIEDSTVDESSLRSYVHDYLPDYMHPSYYLRMDEFPLNLNGKIDKRSLPRPEDLLYEKLSYEAPANELEEKIATIWSNILGLKRVGVLNSFFELGGHSLTATRVVSRIFQELEKEISLKDFFDHPTVRSLSILLTSKANTTYCAIEPVPEQEHYDASHAQKRLWITDQLYGSIPYHMSGGCYINKALDVEAFNKVFQTIVERHESLRTTFVEIKGEPRQKIHAISNFKLEYFNLVDDTLKEQKVADLIKLELTTPFNLKTGPLLRAKLIQLEEQKYLVLFNVHHIVSDGWSTAVLIKEVLVLYEAYRKGEDNPLSPLRIHYKDFAFWQNNLILDTKKRYQSYWHEKLGGDIPALRMPTDYKRPEIKTYEGAKYSFKFDKQMSDDVRKLCVSNEVSLFMFFLAIIDVQLSHLSGQKDILVGSPIAGRNHTELENQIGFYLNNLIVRNAVDRTLTFREFLKQVKQSTLEAYEYQEYPYDKLVEELKPETLEGRNPFYDVLLVMNNEGLNGDMDEMKKLQDILGISELQSDERTSKLDVSFFIDDEPCIGVTLEYSVELFKESTMAKMKDEMMEIVSMTLENSDMNLGDMAWALSGVDKTEMLGTMNEISENF